MILVPGSVKKVWRRVYLLNSSFKSLLSIKTGTTISEATTAAIVPKISETPSPPKTASDASRVEAKIIATAVKKIGFARVAVAKAIASFCPIPLSNIKDFVKSISRSELREEIPIRAIKPISEVAVKKKVPATNKSIT